MINDEAIQHQHGPGKQGTARILLISPCRPGPGSGVAERTLSIYNALSKLAAVDLLLVPPITVKFDARPGENVAPIVGDTVKLTPWFWRRRAYLLKDFLADRAVADATRELHDRNRYTAFFSRYNLGFLADAPSLGPSFVDVDDVPTDTWRSKLPAFNELRRFAFRRAVRRFKTAFVTKSSDLEKVGHASASILPCISTRPESCLPLTAGSSTGRILFVGGTAWWPNREGIERFITKSWPLVRAKVPSAVLRVVGPGGSAVPKAAGVDATDWVDDIRAEYDQADVVICPIRSGAGAPVKLAEAAGFGRAVVATPYGATAYAGLLEAGRDMLVGDSDEEFAEQCIRLLQERELRTAMATRARETARRSLSQAAIDRTIRDAIAPWLSTVQAVE